MKFRDQISLLKEAYEEAKKEEQIVAKAQKEELRKIVREKKEEAKKKIELIKQKLAVDAGNVVYQELSAEELKKSLKFTFQ
jgi:hypothetical protein